MAKMALHSWTPDAVFWDSEEALLERVTDIIRTKKPRKAKAKTVRGSPRTHSMATRSSPSKAVPIDVNGE